MTRRLSRLLLGGICLISLLMVCALQSASLQESKGVLDVVVVEESGQRLAGAMVSVPGYRSTTGINGTCRFGLAAGKYSVLVNKSGFRGKRLTAGVRPGETTSIEVKLQKLQPARPPKK